MPLPTVTGSEGLLGRGVGRLTGDHVGGGFRRLRLEVRAQIALRRRRRERLPQRLVADLPLVERGGDSLADISLGDGEPLLGLSQRRGRLLEIDRGRLVCRRLIEHGSLGGDFLAGSGLLAECRGDLLGDDLVAGEGGLLGGAARLPGLRRLPGRQRRQFLGGLLCLVPHCRGRPHERLGSLFGGGGRRLRGLFGCRLSGGHLLGSGCLVTRPVLVRGLIPGRLLAGLFPAVLVGGRVPVGGCFSGKTVVSRRRYELLAGSLDRGPGRGHFFRRCGRDPLNGVLHRLGHGGQFGLLRRQFLGPRRRRGRLAGRGLPRLSSICLFPDARLVQRLGDAPLGGCGPIRQLRGPAEIVRLRLKLVLLLPESRLSGRVSARGSLLLH